MGTERVANFFKIQMEFIDKLQANHAKGDWILL